MSNDPTWYRVYCGEANDLIDEAPSELLATIIAMNHEAVHRCGTWWERPLDLVAFYAPNVADPPRRQ